MGRSISRREAIARLEAGGWYEVAHEGSHRQFRHPTKPGRTTVPHPVKDLKIGTIKSIEQQSGVKLCQEASMPVLYFPAIIEAGAEPGYGVFFPDLPGCTSAGDTLQEAARNAELALDLHLRGMLEDGDPVPAPSKRDAIAPDSDVTEAARILVRAELPSRSKDSAENRDTCLQHDRGGPAGSSGFHPKRQ